MQLPPSAGSACRTATRTSSWAAACCEPGCHCSTTPSGPGVLAVAPAGGVSHVAVAPVVGAASLVLEAIDASDEAKHRVRQWGLTHDIGRPSGRSSDPLAHVMDDG